MRVALFTSVSANIAGLASLTMPHRLAYCLHHGYSLVIDNRPYEHALASLNDIAELLDVYDLVWAMDADTVITNPAQRIETLPCLGPHMTVCEEGIVPWNYLNCGSVVWRNTQPCRDLCRDIVAAEKEWRQMACVWQTWLWKYLEHLGDTVTVAPLRAFNSCVWNRPGGGDGPAGSHWQPGDFVYHPCGVFPMEERILWLQQTLSQVVR